MADMAQKMLLNCRIIPYLMIYHRETMKYCISYHVYKSNIEIVLYCSNLTKKATVYQRKYWMWSNLNNLLQNVSNWGLANIVWIPLWKSQSVQCWRVIVSDRTIVREHIMKEIYTPSLRTKIGLLYLYYGPIFPKTPAASVWHKRWCQVSCCPWQIIYLMLGENLWLACQSTYIIMDQSWFGGRGYQ